MTKQEAPLQQLKQYLPEGSFDEVSDYLEKYKVQLTITRERKTLLGDYRNSFAGKSHRISVNGNLNPYAFLITLLLARRLDEPEAASLEELLREILIQSPQRFWVRFWPR